MEKSTMTTKGRIIIPANIRKRHGLKLGTKIRFIERDNEILLLPVTKEHVRSVRAMLTSKRSVTKELLDERKKDGQTYRRPRLGISWGCWRRRKKARRQ